MVRAGSPKPSRRQPPFQTVPWGVDLELLRPGNGTSEAKLPGGAESTFERISFGSGVTPGTSSSGRTWGRSRVTLLHPWT